MRISRGSSSTYQLNLLKHCINNQLLELHLFIVGFSMVHACDIHVVP